MVGIESIKDALKTVIKVGTTVEDALEDKKVNFFEAIAIAKNSIGLWGVVKDFPNIKAEFLDLDGDEKQELIEYFADELDLDNDAVEVIIEKCFDFIINATAFLEIFKGESD